MSDFVKSFFGSDNEINYGVNSTHDELLRPWIFRFESELPFMLPRIEGEKLWWYVFYHTKSQGRKVGTDLKAFFGCAFGDFSGRPYDLSRGDEFERRMERFFSGCYLLEVHDKQGFLTARDRLIRVWDSQPELHQVYKKSIGYLLRDFEIALRVGSDQDASALIEKIRDTAHLSAENLNYLRLKLLGRMSRWSEIVDDANFSHLVFINPPYKIREILITAFYEVHLREFEDDGAVALAIAKMLEVKSQLGRLLIHLGGMSSPSVLKVFLLRLAGSPEDAEQRDVRDLIERVSPKTSDRDYLEAIGRHITFPSLKTSSDLKTFVQNYDFESCYVLLIDKDLILPEEVQYLIQSAWEIDTADVVSRTVDRVSLLDPELLEEAFSVPFFEKKWELLQAKVQAPVGDVRAPVSWEEWARMVNESDGFWRSAHEVAESISGDVNLSPYLNSAGRVDELRKELSLMDSENQKYALKLSFPHLLNFFLPDPATPDQCLSLLYHELVTILSLDDSLGVHDLSVLYELISALLCLGQKKRVLDYLDCFYEENFSVSNLNWALDTVDLLVQYGLGLEFVNRGLFVPVINLWNSPSLSKLGDEDKRCIEFLAEELSVATQLKVMEKKELSCKDTVTLSSSMIAIYTLTESAGERAKMLIEKIYSPKRVEVNTDKGGTEKLKALARNSDIFIMVTSSAKHAATKFIQNHRDRTKPLLYPAGKGSSSIISSLNTHLSA